jgi:Ca-activated chloride channel family protein
MNPDDPLLTTYALGELTEPAERARVEAALAADPSLREQVESIRSTVALLEGAFAAEPMPQAPDAEENADETANLDAAPKSNVVPFQKLSAASRRARLAQLEKDAPTLKRSKSTNFNAMAAAMVACLALAGLWLVQNFTKVFDKEENYLVQVDIAKEEDLKPRSELADEIAAKMEADAASEAAQRELALARLEAVELMATESVAESSSTGGAAASSSSPAKVFTLDVAKESSPFTPSNFSIPEVAVLPDEIPLGIEVVHVEGGDDFKDALSYTSGVSSAETNRDAMPSSITILPESATAPEPERARIAALDKSAVTLGFAFRDPPPAPAALPPPPSMALMYNVESVPRGASGSYTADGDLAAAVDRMQAPLRESISSESYDAIKERSFVSPLTAPRSTFSIDVDTASYANVRRLLREGETPPAGAVRIEELVNYFSYDGVPPETRDPPFSVDLELAEVPWAPEHQLVRIGLNGYELPWTDRPASNLVFLIDVSGSMNEPGKLPLVKESLRKLVRQLDDRDRVAIVTYAGAEHLALPSTTANNHATIMHAIDQLGAGGSTAGAAGIQRAYAEARSHYIARGNNRIILCTDGDFNVGTANTSDLVDLVAQSARSGVYLSVFGFGRGNFQDAMLEQITNNGNGTYAYIDGSDEADKLFVEGAAGTLLTIAKDVKVQVEFNPARVQAYRLIGYENRAMAAHEFRDDAKDAGEMGSGHHVTALYEIVPPGVSWEQPETEPLRYQRVESNPDSEATAAELLTVRLRYKLPDGNEGKEFARSLKAVDAPRWEQASEDFRWAAAVAAFGMILRDSEYRGSTDWDLVERLARSAVGNDPEGRRTEFLHMIALARSQVPTRAERRRGS